MSEKKSARSDLKSGKASNKNSKPVSAR